MEKQLDDNTTNRIIAEFMGYGIIENDVLITNEFGEFVGRIKYTESLDALVPVWEKLGMFMRIEDYVACEGDHYWEFEFLDKKIIHKGIEQTIQQAAAHATALAIKELNK